MKYLKVKWAPDTHAIVSLPVTGEEARNHVYSAASQNSAGSRTCTKLIVITGSIELRADVTELERQAA